MASKRSIANNQLNPGATYVVRGQVGFSRVARQTTDAERERDNKNRMHPIDKNYTHITIYNAQVIPEDPQNPTIEDRYAVECLYRSSSANYPGNNFSAMNKSSKLPRVFVLNSATGQYDETKITNELAAGLNVMLVMRVFKGQGNIGVSLDRILVTEPIKYYAGDSAVEKDLVKRGIVLNSLPVDTTPTTAGKQTEAAPTNDDGGYVDEPPYAAPVDNAFGTMDTNTAPAGSNPFSSYSANNQFGAGNRQY